MRNKQDVLPEEFVYRLRKLGPSNIINSCLHSFTVKRPTTIRANILKISARNLRNIFFEKGIKLENVLWYRDGFIVKNRTLRELMDFEISANDRNFLDPQLATDFQSDNTSTSSKENQKSNLSLPSSKCDLRKYQSFRCTSNSINFYREGFFYVQSLSSMIPALVLDPQPGEKILDICAAPGSKTTQISAMMGNKGEILANDTSPIRRLRLEANLKMQGVTNTYVRGFSAQSIWEKFPEFFNKTLCDVPCSMEGRFHTFDPDTYSDWSVKKVQNLSHMQKWMLRSAISATKPGGVIVYSTCTLSPEENEEVIDWILQKEKGKIIIEKLSVVSSQLSAAVMEWEGREYNPEVVKTGRIYPTPMMEGFFVACIRKIKSNIPEGGLS